MDEHVRGKRSSTGSSTSLTAATADSKQHPRKKPKKDGGMTTPPDQIATQTTSQESAPVALPSPSIAGGPGSASPSEFKTVEALPVSRSDGEISSRSFGIKPAENDVQRVMAGATTVSPQIKRKTDNHTMMFPDGRLEMFSAALKNADGVGQTFKPRAHVIALGQSRAGKSTTICHAMKQKDFSSTNRGRGTHVIVKHSAAQTGQVAPYLVEVQFEPRNAITTSIHRYIAEIRSNSDEAESSETAEECLQHIYPAEKEHIKNLLESDESESAIFDYLWGKLCESGMVPHSVLQFKASGQDTYDEDDDEDVSSIEKMNADFEASKSVVFECNNEEETNDVVKRFSRPWAHCGQIQPSPWPFIHEVRVYHTTEYLQPRGLILADVPGVPDENMRAQGNTLRCLDGAGLILIFLNQSSCMRGTVGNTELADLDKIRMDHGKDDDSVVIVVTHTDKIPMIRIRKDTCQLDAEVYKDLIQTENEFDSRRVKRDEAQQRYKQADAKRKKLSAAGQDATALLDLFEESERIEVALNDAQSALDEQQSIRRRKHVEEQKRYIAEQLKKTIDCKVVFIDNNKYEQLLEEGTCSSDDMESTGIPHLRNILHEYATKQNDGLVGY